jgi:hypothetical protein
MKNLQKIFQHPSNLNFKKRLSEINIYVTNKKFLHLRLNTILPDNKYKHISSEMNKNVYSKQNIRSQKIFSFTQVKKDKIFIEERNSYKKKFENIKKLENTIRSLENYIYSNQIKIDKSKSLKILEESEVIFNNEKVEINEALDNPLFLNRYPCAFHLELLQNKKEELYYLKVEQAEYRKKYLEDKKENDKKQHDNTYDNTNDYAYLKCSMIRDVFSSFHNYGNKLLDRQTYENMTNEMGERPQEVVEEEKELALKQSALEGEVESIVDEMVEKQMKDFDVKSADIPHHLPVKPIIRSIVVNPNQPDILLLEGDLNCNYGLDLEWERLVRINLNDDFGKNIADEKKEDNEEDDDEEEVSKEEGREEVHYSELIGKGEMKNGITIDTSISSISNM